MRILVVDDSKMARTVLTKLLEPYGVVDAVKNGDEALEAFKASCASGSPYSLITMDYFLGTGLFGSEVLKKIHKMRSELPDSINSRIKVLMLTSFASAETVAEVKNLCDAYLLKPLSKEKFLEKIHRFGFRPCDSSDETFPERFLTPAVDWKELLPLCHLEDAAKVPLVSVRDGAFLFLDGNVKRDPAFIARYSNLPRFSVIARVESPDMKLRCGNGTAFIPEKNLIVSRVGGRVVFIDGEFHVETVAKMAAPTRPCSIEFEGDIIIDGDVREGVSLKSGSDIMIEGIVDGGVLTAARNIRVRRYNGRGTGSATCGGSFGAEYVYSAEINAGGGVFIGREALDCRIRAKGDLTGGHLIGGVYESGGNIDIVSAGSKSEMARTTLRAGLNIPLLNELEMLESEKKHLEEEAEHTLRLIGEKFKLTLARLNEVPEEKRVRIQSLAEHRFKIIRKDIPVLIRDIAEIKEKMIPDFSRYIRIRETIRRGVRLEAAGTVGVVTRGVEKPTLFPDGAHLERTYGGRENLKLEDLRGRKIMILGYGVSGRAAARLASALQLIPVVVDTKNTPEMLAEFMELPRGGAERIFAWNKEIPLPECELAVVSPGVPVDSEMALAAEEAGAAVIGELEFAWLAIPSSCRIVAITGTNGKTTTTELATEFFRAVGDKAESAGNIGLALSDSALKILKYPDRIDTLVVECSSFQLETVVKFRPHAAAVLNLAVDHINRHGSMLQYAHAKFNIFRNMERTRDNVILNANILPTARQLVPKLGEVTTFSSATAADFHCDGSQILFRDKVLTDQAGLNMPGPHNAENIMAAFALLRALHGDEAMLHPEIRNVLKNFKLDGHRMDFFAEFNAVRFVDDSKGTNPHSVVAALRTFGGNGNVVLILGGLDKNMDFSSIAEENKRIKCAVMYGECGPKIYETLSQSMESVLCESFEDAVNTACSKAEPGDIVALSPACASQDMFRDYQHRGDCFKELIFKRYR